ncbi:MAG TPA: AmmeMemoRadiSam system protein A [Clostridia bacterium]|nr:AmmeMemoRadiSam system protein A [Clostridia bacterium]
MMVNKNTTGPTPQNPYVALARASIEYYLRDRAIMQVPEDTPEALLATRAGAFVTLYKAGNLRGCIGTIHPVRKSLAHEIIHNAVASAVEDPRFPPLNPDELKDIVVSVDVLGDAEPIDTFEELDPARYGVIVSDKYRRGLLLPNLDGIDTAEEQVSIALRKAGIYPGDSYRLERFEVVRYEEKP